MEETLQKLIQNTMLIEFLTLLFVAGLCGSIAQRLTGGKGVGCLASIALGFIGALVGTIIAIKFDLPLMFTLTIQGKQFPIIWSVIGAALFSALLALLSGRGRENRKD